MASVELKNVSKIFHPKKNEEVHAVTNLNFSINDKELVVLVGPSGCGKTTTLRLIAGLEEISSGAISIDGKPMNSVPPQDRDVAMVFQRDALYPHMTVFQNMAFGLQLRRVPKDQIKMRVQDTVEMLGLAQYLARFPRELSGGQRQRAALGRALVRQPKILLLDEPLSHLDAPLRLQLRSEISRLNRELGATMLYVTHDQNEALTLGQRIIVMNNGLMEQIADPKSLRAHPANEFVANFFNPERAPLI
jgi:multiple sugar transport system ATP-binding protein